MSGHKKSNVGPARMAAACAALLRTIEAAARDGGPTPSYTVLEGEMRAQGVAATQTLVGKALQQLEADGALRREGHRNARVYVLPDGSSTRVAAPGEARDGSDGDPLDNRRGWPRPTKSGAASYDAAVAARGFADNRKGAETWVHSPVRASGPARSLTGCAAAMTVESR